MQKIPTMFMRDESQKGHPVKDEIKPECQWVLDGEGIATRKIDGTNVKIVAGQLFKRQKPKARDYDEASYVPCDRANPADKWSYEGMDAGHDGDGIYELIGPKVQGNPDGRKAHVLVRVVPPSHYVSLDQDGIRSIAHRYGLTFTGLRQWLTDHPVEGLVFHHDDGRLAKIKRRDFGLPWPVRGD
jgi:hypothetical protein